MKKRTYSISNIISVLISLSLLGAIFIPDHFITNLFRSLILQIGLLSFFMLIISLYKSHKIGTVLNLGHCLIVLFFVSQVITYPQYSNKTPYDIKIAHFNVLKTNQNHKEIIDAAMRSQADILSFQETDTAWINDLSDSLKAIYPYSFVVPIDNNYFGIAVLSKYPLKNTKAIYFGSRPNIAGDIIYQGTAIHFLASHTIPPMLGHFHDERNKHIKGIGAYLNTVKGPKFAFGDFNTTPWDKSMIEFKATTQLADGRPGICATYPSWLNMAMIPIDYIFHSNEFKCTNYNNIIINSSDHYGIEACYKLNTKQLAIK